MNKTTLLGALGAVALAATSVAGQASASTIVTVNAHDDFYTPFTGSIDSADVGAAAELTWQSAGYFWTGNIQLINDAGVTLFDIETSGDNYTLFAPASAGPHLGETCVADADTGCVTVQSGVAVSLYETINSLNGGNGIFAGRESDILVTVTDAGGGVPEPAAWALMLVGFGGIGATLRRARRAPAALAA